MPFLVTLRLTPHNRGSIAALLAVIEAELPAGLIRPRIARDSVAITGEGLLVYSFMTARAASVTRELADLRQRLGDDPLAIAGGPHANGDPEGTLAMGFRWVSAGEAGPTFARFLRELAAGKVPAAGLLPADPPQPLDHYPPWPRSGDLFCAIELTRGCPIGCAFCQSPALHGRRPRHRSLAELRTAFTHAVATGHTFTRFVSPNAFAYGSADGRTPNPRAVEELLIAARDCGMRRVFLGGFPSEVRPESVTPEMLDLVRTHCDNQAVVVGLQSGSPVMLERLRRGHTVRQGIDAVAMIAAAGLTPKVDFIFGLPEETDQDRALTRDLIRFLVQTYGARIDTHLFGPLPGTLLAAAVPSRVDAATLDLLAVITGKGHANALRCFRTSRLVATVG